MPRQRRGGEDSMEYRQFGQTETNVPASDLACMLDGNAAQQFGIAQVQTVGV